MRELRPLTPDRVGDLVGSCAPCTFWQTVPRNGHSDPSEPLVLLAEWVESVTADWTRALRSPRPAYSGVVTAVTSMSVDGSDGEVGKAASRATCRAGATTTCPAGCPST